MNQRKLILFTRVGCCLCEALEEHLRNISLDQLKTPLNLCVRDIDGLDVPNSLKTIYSLKVPVLLVEGDTSLTVFELPRVSPRLSKEELFCWLNKVMQEKTEWTPVF
ncbi:MULTISPECIES: glutaredoxin family protein [unclassified Prochlorococcus]|uniref:glutaredoxin family protein n=1 Tax=unclassified Prochlorococcus TaxID=2627481 RepID=UPI00053389D6|nr:MULTISPECIES: glutaredoxin family protein [unclassified Prochlorococcus]KGG16548.1 Thioredoxin family protein [Prochlorococcus sp. MIT 0602]KGG16977.1 Thioredoxin family protein [Prochlorococcus sp. MIT 0603]